MSLSAGKGYVSPSACAYMVSYSLYSSDCHVDWWLLFGFPSHRLASSCKGGRVKLGVKEGREMDRGGSSMDLPIMHDNDRYELVKDIGSGNFGVARLMRDKQTKELVAVKYIERGEKVPSLLPTFPFLCVSCHSSVAKCGVC
eukprot:Gb_33674 [translate_table: standard]